MWAPGPIWTGVKNLAHTGFFILLYSVYTSSVLVSLSWLSRILSFCLYLQHTTQTSMPPAGYESAIPASDRPQTLALDRTATGIGKDSNCPVCSDLLYRLSYSCPHTFSYRRHNKKHNGVLSDFLNQLVFQLIDATEDWVAFTPYAGNKNNRLGWLTADDKVSWQKSIAIHMDGGDQLRMCTRHNRIINFSGKYVWK